MVYNMSQVITTQVIINEESLENKLNKLIQDKATMTEVHSLFAQMCNPYVPMDEGVLSQTLEITDKSVRYNVPYAHYQYIGEVYGPNIPIIEDGVIVGWFSPPGQPKTPTGRPIEYNTEKHPLATKEWDKAMIRDRGDEFKARVTEILKRRAKELNV